MPTADVGGVKLDYEEAGQGTPLLFVHEFAGDGQSWRPQVRFFSRRYRTITFNARGYPPSDVPEDPRAYSQRQAVDDVRGVLDHLGISRAHVCGLSMGGYATLHFGLDHPARALSLVVAGAGYGSDAYSQRQAVDDVRGVLDHLGISRAHVCGLSMGGYATLHFGLDHPARALSLVVAGAGYGSDDPARHRAECEVVARRFETEGMEAAGDAYSRGSTRVQFMEKDPLGWQEFHDRLTAGSARGHALTLRGVQMTRPAIYDLGERLERLAVPTLVVTGDEDAPCLEPALYLKRKIRTAGLVVLPRSGHTINLEEPGAFNRAVLDFLTAVDAGRWTPRHPDALTGSPILPRAAR